MAALDMAVAALVEVGLLAAVLVALTDLTGEASSGVA